VATFGLGLELEEVETGHEKKLQVLENRGESGLTRMRTAGFVNDPVADLVPDDLEDAAMWPEVYDIRRCASRTDGRCVKNATLDSWDPDG
jgi:hypothetical protein